MPTTANASFSSQYAISSIFNPALETAFGTATDGVVVNHSGACSASANERIFAIGFNPNSFALSALINTNAAAPSFMVEAFAAVTVPSFIKAGLREGILSNLTLKGSSSLANTIGSPLRCGISTGTISLANKPFSQADCDRL